MGRLYRKFFLFFFLAHFATVTGVGLTIWWQQYQREVNRQAIEETPPAETVVEAAASVLQHGGIKALTTLLQNWRTRHMPQVYVVDANEHDIFDRYVHKSILESADKMADSKKDGRFVKRITLSGDASYLLFVPDMHVQRLPSLFDTGGRENPLNFGFRSPPPNDNDSPNGKEPPSSEPEGTSPDKGKEALVQARPELGGDMVTQEAHQEDRAKRPRRPSFFPFSALLAGTFVSLVFAAFLAWYFSKPIKSLSAAFEEAANGRLDVRVSHTMGSRHDELTDLGRDFDSMAGRLGSLIQGQTRLLHHVSHELRSPLARMQMAIGLARQNAEKIPAALDRIERESERMDKLVGELLQLSRLESGVMSLRKEEVDMSLLLASVAEDARFEALGKHIRINTVFQQHFVVMGEAEMLHRAIENIVRNAIKYSPEHSQVDIEMGLHDVEKPGEKLSEKSVEHFVLVVINDQGDGVPEDELESIFKPFVRSSKAQSDEGHGVGLAIAKQVIEAHSGKIQAKNRVVGGLSVEITLPYISLRKES